jgi:hypothetical protein
MNGTGQPTLGGAPAGGLERGASSSSPFKTNVLRTVTDGGHDPNFLICNKSFKSMEKFKYLGTTATKQICIHEGVKSRLNSGNA